MASKHKHYIAEKLKTTTPGLNASGTHDIEQQISYWTNIHQMIVKLLIDGKVEEAINFALYCNIKISEEMVQIEKLYFLPLRAQELTLYASVPPKTKTKFTSGLLTPFVEKANKKQKEKKKQNTKPEPPKAELPKAKVTLPQKRNFNEAFEQKAEKLKDESNLQASQEPKPSTSKAIATSWRKSMAKKQKLTDSKPQTSLMLFFNKK